jgi:hypothetical protein
MHWLVKFLSRHPAVQRKLYRELAAELPPLGERMVTYEELSSTTHLPYLSAVVYEILRICRTAPASSRETTCDTVMLGHRIPKGTLVVFPLGYVQEQECSAHPNLDNVSRAAHRSRFGGVTVVTVTVTAVKMAAVARPANVCNGFSGPRSPPFHIWPSTRSTAMTTHLPLPPL